MHDSHPPRVGLGSLVRVRHEAVSHLVALAVDPLGFLAVEKRDGSTGFE